MRNCNVTIHNFFPLKNLIFHLTLHLFPSMDDLQSFPLFIDTARLKTNFHRSSLMQNISTRKFKTKYSKLLIPHCINNKQTKSHGYQGNIPKLHKQNQFRTQLQARKCGDSNLTSMLTPLTKRGQVKLPTNIHFNRELNKM